MAQLDFVATCTRGAEEVLAAELTAMGVPYVHADRGAVLFSGGMRHGYRACLWSRIASRVLLVLDRFPAPDADALHDGVASLDWREHLNPRSTFRVDFVGTNPEIRNTRFGAQVCKDAVHARFDRMVPRVDLHHPDLRVHLHLRGDQAQVALDLAGEPMHMRTPGRKGGEAPMRENLAAALLHIAGWPAAAAEGAPLVDPMCGSGTLLVEAAGIALDIAPGLVRRTWGFTAWLGHDVALWNTERQAAEDRREAGAGQPLHVSGGDLLGTQVSLAQRNLAAVGLERVSVAERAVADQGPPGPEEGLVVINPPYGERLGADQDLAALYGEIGNVLRRRFMGWTGWVLVSEPRLASAIGLRPKRRVPIHNGPIECRWLSFPVRRERVARDR